LQFGSCGAIFAPCLLEKIVIEVGVSAFRLYKKTTGVTRVIKTVGVAKTQREKELLILLAQSEISRLRGMESLFIEHDDIVVESFVNSIANDHLQIVGSELILGKIYQVFHFPDDGSRNYFSQFSFMSTCLSWE
jgi:hypothetical protein